MLDLALVFLKEFEAPYHADGYSCMVIGKDAYQTVRIQPPEIKQHFDPQLLSRPAPNLFGFRMPAERYQEMDIYLKAFLKVPDVLGYRFAQQNAILNDSWTVNLRSTNQTENVLMNSFLGGFAVPEGTQPIVVDATNELKELKRIYDDAFGHMQKKEAEALNHLVYSMKRFIEVHEERQKVEQKKTTLDSKLQLGKKEEPCGCDDDEDEDGEE